MSELGFCAYEAPFPSSFTPLAETASRTSVGEPTVLLPYWRLHLPASNLSPRMICAYTGYHAPHPLGHAHRSRQYPAQACRGVYRRELGRTAPLSAATRYRSLQRLFRWLDDGGEIDGSPMAKMYPRSSRSSNPSTCTYTVARPPWAAAFLLGFVLTEDPRSTSGRRLPPGRTPCGSADTRYRAGCTASGTASRAYTPAFLRTGRQVGDNG